MLGQTEAFPEPLNFWKRRSDNRILEQNDKFRMETYTDGYELFSYSHQLANNSRTSFARYHYNSYRSWMRLNISRIRSEDFGEYQCVSKNEINTTSATFFIYGYYYDYIFFYYSHQLDNSNKDEHFISAYIDNSRCRWSTSSNANLFRNRCIWLATT